MRSHACSNSVWWLSCAAILGLVLSVGCGSEDAVPHTVVAVEGKHIVGALNALSLKQTKPLAAELLASVQSYQWPALESTEDTAVLRSLIPEAVGAWQLGEDTRLYTGDALAEYLTNSRLYHDYGFVEMVGSVYYETHLSKDPLLQVDLYRMGTPLDAFGIYSLQRNVQTRPQKIGTEAVLTSESLDAWKGNYHLKIQAWSIADAFSEGMVRIAQEVFRRIDGQADVSSLFRLFPAEGKLPGTERFFHTYRALDQITLVPTINVLQLTPDTNGILAEYRNQGSTLEFDTMVLFCVEYPTPEDALAAFEFYRAYSQQRGGVASAQIGSLSFAAVDVTLPGD